MLVTRSSFREVLLRLETPGTYALDTETTGLSAYKGDRLFSIIVAQGEESWYFNFNDYEGTPEDEVLDDWHKLELQICVFGREDHTWILHNAKFDMHMLGVDGLTLAGPVFCTYAHGRLLHNDMRYYNLDFLSQRWLGVAKSDAVKDYALEHKLYDEVVKGKQKKKNIHFWRVPLPVVLDYAEKDGTLAFALGAYEQEAIRKIDAFTQTNHPGLPPLSQVSDNETALTKVLYEVERVGVQLDKDYTERALEAERRAYAAAAKELAEMVGRPFEDSPSWIGSAFKQLGIEAPKSNNRVLTNKVVLSGIQHPLADLIQTHRKAYKKATTYYANFLAMADEHGTIHPDFHQGGTKTGRLSCRDPNLQNLNRPDDSADDEDQVFEVRRCFVPRDGFCFFAPDYDQIEYRMMLNYAQEQSVIERVLAGMDVHQATADMLGVSRFHAKTINFMLIYGGGIDKLASMLKLSWEDAKRAREDYFRKLPRIAAFVQRVRDTAGRRGYLYNWFGRYYTFDNPESVYTTAPNWLIQGGCSDVLKIAMIRCHEYLQQRGAFSRIVLNVHDEIVFELEKGELHYARELVSIMENVYMGGALKLTAGPAFSWKSLADKEDGFPVYSKHHPHEEMHDGQGDEASAAAR